MCVCVNDVNLVSGMAQDQDTVILFVFRGYGEFLPFAFGTFGDGMGCG